jgi:hypothetical protein
MGASVTARTEEAAARSPAVGDVWVEPTGAVRVVYDVAANGYAIAATFSGRTRALQGRPGSHSIAPSPGRFAGRVDPTAEGPLDVRDWRPSPALAALRDAAFALVGPSLESMRGAAAMTARLDPAAAEWLARHGVDAAAVATIARDGERWEP